jgi:hypothetical protein
MIVRASFAIAIDEPAAIHLLRAFGYQQAAINFSTGCDCIAARLWIEGYARKDGRPEFSD